LICPQLVDHDCSLLALHVSYGSWMSRDEILRQSGIDTKKGSPYQLRAL